jgi:hypothetical protein
MAKAYEQTYAFTPDFFHILTENFQSRNERELNYSSSFWNQPKYQYDAW